MTNTQDALLPCPFCGGEAGIKRMGTNRVSMQIACTDCGCFLETGETFLSTNCRWNTRPQPPAPGNKDALEALKYLNDMVKVGYTSMTMAVFFQHYEQTIRTALSNTYDPATHILVAREDVPDNLTMRFKLMAVGDDDSMRRILKFIELIAQKTEE